MPAADRPLASDVPRRVAPVRGTLVAIVLTLHAVLLAWNGYVSSPAYDEVAHLSAGVSYWSTGSFELYRVNPPLVRLVAAAPVMMANPHTDWSSDRHSSSPFAGPELAIGQRFMNLNGRTSFWYFTLARWACLPFSLLGGWICYRWARDLYGSAAGLTALVLWCSSPSILAWGATITPDVGASALGLTAGYLFWRWLKTPTWKHCLFAGLALGLAELAKTTWLVLLPLWPVLWLLARPRDDADPATTNVGNGNRPIGAQARQLAALVLLAVGLINLGYGFEGSFSRLDRFQFASAALSGQATRATGGNRFRDTVLGRLPVPLPENYVRGIDLQKYDFERGKWSYLRGQQKLGGWFHYYLYGLLVKTPLGTILLAGLAVGLSLRSRTYRAGWRDEVVLLAAPLIVLLLVSSQTGFNRYLRYVLPAVPFLFVAASRVARDVRLPGKAIRVAAALALTWSVVASLLAFPHSMSFFNVLVGGPIHGHAHLVDANIDWGQDLHHLRRWLDQHPEARPLHLRYFGAVDPRLAGIEAEPVYPGPHPAIPRADPRQLGPRPGWYAISVNELVGYRHYGLSRPLYTYFQRLRPVARCGYSIYVYHVSLAQANALREEFGLPAIED